MCLCVYVFMCLCIYVFMCLCIYVFMCLCVYGFMCLSFQLIRTIQKYNYVEISKQSNKHV